MSRVTHAQNRPENATTPGTPEVEAELRRRLETFEEDAKTGRTWEAVHADLKSRRQLPSTSR